MRSHYNVSIYSHLDKSCDPTIYLYKNVWCVYLYECVSICFNTYIINIIIMYIKITTCRYKYITGIMHAYVFTSGW